MPTASFRFAYPQSTRRIDIRDLAINDAATVVLGVNGAGKTTMLRCLAGQFKLQRGKLPSADGTVYVPHKFMPISGFNVADYISYVGWLQGAPLRQAQKDALTWAEFVGLQGDVTRQECRQLSGGQQAKLQLAAALNSQARWLLLDEPSATLDPIAKQELRQLYRDVINRGIRLWVSSHQPLEVGEPFEQVIVLDHGCLAFQGRIDDFIGFSDDRTDASDTTWRGEPISPTVLQLSAVHRSEA